MGRSQPTKRSQQLVFTLYGDYLREWSDEVWTGSLIGLLEPFGLTGQAVRSTLSRMARLGWLRARRAGRLSYYRLTPRGERIVADASQRLFRPSRPPWDGRWHLVTYSIPERRRELRDRLRQRLVWYGFGRLSAGSWISPYPVPEELGQWLESTGARPYAELFTAQIEGRGEARQLVARAWDFQQLHAAYEAFLSANGLNAQLNGQGLDALAALEPAAAFARRVQLTLDVLSFPYVDPRLPAELLPPDWLGDRAAELFERQHQALADPARRFVADRLAVAPETAPTPVMAPELVA